MFGVHRHRRRRGQMFDQPNEPECSRCPAGCFPLSMAPCDECVRLVDIHGGHGMRRRMAELGLNPGCQLRVVHSHGGGPMILAVKDDARMAIGRGMAHRIMVSAPTDSDESEA